MQGAGEVRVYQYCVQTCAHLLSRKSITCQSLPLPNAIFAGALLAKVEGAEHTSGFSFSSRDGNGKAVMGIAAGPLASHADVLPYFQWDVPANWTVRSLLTLNRMYRRPECLL